MRTSWRIPRCRLFRCSCCTALTLKSRRLPSRASNSEFALPLFSSSSLSNSLHRSASGVQPSISVASGAAPCCKSKRRVLVQRRPSRAAKQMGWSKPYSKNGRRAASGSILSAALILSKLPNLNACLSGGAPAPNGSGAWHWLLGIAFAWFDGNFGVCGVRNIMASGLTSRGEAGGSRCLGGVARLPKFLSRLASSGGASERDCGGGGVARRCCPQVPDGKLGTPAPSALPRPDLIPRRGEPIPEPPARGLGQGDGCHWR
mmetsp:Transcript_90219/g.234009  ORF Transcript_90219/g.234009 Transcript_90219/m.234009 type:complete len:260 (-) Transcript_90219:132-911(-)